MPLAFKMLLSLPLALTGLFVNSFPLLMSLGPGSQSPHYTFPDRTLSNFNI